LKIAIIPPAPATPEGLPFTLRENPTNKKAGIHHIATNRIVFTRYLSSFI
tara:strand:- start:354 stop:503 length:150 start_codon:yes stop_codon:yes gene_type:complete